MALCFFITQKKILSPATAGEESVRISPDSSKNTSTYLDSLLYLQSQSPSRHTYNSGQGVSADGIARKQVILPHSVREGITWKGETSRTGIRRKRALLSKTDYKFEAERLMKEARVTRILLPRMLLIAGNGRNVGKTTLACNIISHLSKSADVTAMKISPHFHDYSENEIILKNDKFVILEEKKTTLKDSSLMLQAGAKKVFYLMVAPEFLKEAFEQLTPLLPDTPIVCESGGLHEWVQPGLFLFVNLYNREIVKPELLKFQPKLVMNDGVTFSFNPESLCFTDRKIKMIDE